MTTLTLVRQATAAVAITAALTLPAVTAHAQEAVFGRGVYWFHNDSAMTILRDGRSLQIRYADPRSGLGRRSDEGTERVERTRSGAPCSYGGREAAIVGAGP